MLKSEFKQVSSTVCYWEGILNVPHKLRIGPDFNSSETLDFEETVLNFPAPSRVTRTTLKFVPPKSSARKLPCSLPTNFGLC